MTNLVNEIHGSLHSPPLKAFRPRKGKRREKEELDKQYILFKILTYKQ